jgi:hemerythrin superfamily protein
MSHATRSAAEQSEAQLGGPGSILVRQREDHAELDRLMRAYEAASDCDARARLLDEVSERALRHAFAEETVLFPTCRRLLPDSADVLTAHIEGEHQAINDLLAELTEMRPTEIGFEGHVRRVFALIRDDARAEEDVLLPRLRLAVGDDELRKIGKNWERARSTSPTRPHPNVSRRPPGNILAAGSPALTDRLKDGGGQVLPRGGPARTLAAGLCAGLVGVAVMTAGEKLEQALTGRRNSDMPRRTPQRLVGVQARGPAGRFALNHAMHWGQGVALGTVRALMARHGVRGLPASLAFAALRFGADQTLENATGAGSPPSTWPRDELVMDVGHKVVYALATGAVADRLLRV